jgi:lipopolysaccharide/colanic/teichoic acid biosynthesis glycosyltransferase
MFPPGIPVSKRLFDLALTLPGLVLISPVLILLAVLVRWKLGHPVLFTQMRPGYREKPFAMIKFRSMTGRRDTSGMLLPDEQRLTKLGRFMRSYSLDELPELFNVLRGEMSLVGPRPLLMRYLERYSPEQHRRHDVLPGITGWAQVNGRNMLAWEEKFHLDVWYVDHWSIRLDIRILWMTMISALKREGISHPEHATAPEFMGNEPQNTDSGQDSADD